MTRTYCSKVNEIFVFFCYIAGGTRQTSVSFESGDSSNRNNLAFEMDSRESKSVSWKKVDKVQCHDTIITTKLPHALSPPSHSFISFFIAVTKTNIYIIFKFKQVLTVSRNALTTYTYFVSWRLCKLSKNINISMYSIESFELYSHMLPFV